MENLSELLAAINAILWNGTWLYIIVGTGILFTVWSGVSQYRALTHGPAVVRGVYDNPDDPGAINHFQALLSVFRYPQMTLSVGCMLKTFFQLL